VTDRFSCSASDGLVLYLTA